MSRTSSISRLTPGALIRSPNLWTQIPILHGRINTNSKPNSLSFLQIRLSCKPRFFTTRTTMEAERVKLPGFGLPVNYRPDEHFPNAVLDWSGTILTVRELNMMTIMDKITDKPDWDKKVFDDTIVQKWRHEALATEGMDVSEKMLDWVCTTFPLRHRSIQNPVMAGCLVSSPFKRLNRLCLRASLMTNSSFPSFFTSLPTLVFAISRSRMSIPSPVEEP